MNGGGEPNGVVYKCDSAFCVVGDELACSLFNSITGLKSIVVELVDSKKFSGYCCHVYDYESQV